MRSIAGPPRLVPVVDGSTSKTLSRSSDISLMVVRRCFVSHLPLGHVNITCRKSYNKEFGTLRTLIPERSLCYTTTMKMEKLIENSRCLCHRLSVLAFAHASKHGHTTRHIFPIRDNSMSVGVLKMMFQYLFQPRRHRCCLQYIYSGGVGCRIQTRPAPTSNIRALLFRQRCKSTVIKDLVMDLVTFAYKLISGDFIAIPYLIG